MEPSTEQPADRTSERRPADFELVVLDAHGDPHLVLEARAGGGRPPRPHTAEAAR